MKVTSLWLMQSTVQRKNDVDKTDENIFQEKIYIFICICTHGVRSNRVEILTYFLFCFNLFVLWVQVTYMMIHNTSNRFVKFRQNLSSTNVHPGTNKQQFKNIYFASVSLTKYIAIIIF